MFSAALLTTYLASDLSCDVSTEDVQRAIERVRFIRVVDVLFSRLLFSFVCGSKVFPSGITRRERVSGLCTSLLGVHGARGTRRQRQRSVGACCFCILCVDDFCFFGTNTAVFSLSLSLSPPPPPFSLSFLSFFSLFSLAFRLTTGKGLSTQTNSRICWIRLPLKRRDSHLLATNSDIYWRRIVVEQTDPQQNTGASTLDRLTPPHPCCAHSVISCSGTHATCSHAHATKHTNTTPTHKCISARIFGLVTLVPSHQRCNTHHYSPHPPTLLYPYPGKSTVPIFRALRISYVNLTYENKTKPKPSPYPGSRARVAR